MTLPFKRPALYAAHTTTGFAIHDKATGVTRPATVDEVAALNSQVTP